MLAYYVSRPFARSSHARWPAIIQAALVPLSIGLMAASGLILARTSDRSWVAALVTVAAAVLAFATRLNPFWMLLAGGIFGFLWPCLTKIASRLRPRADIKQAIHSAGCSREDFWGERLVWAIR